MRKMWMLVLACWALAVHAGEAPGVAQLEGELLSANPEIKVLELQVQAQALLEKPAGSLPDPMVELMLTNLDFPEPGLGRQATAGVSLRQGLLFPGKRQARWQMAEAETALRHSELKLLKARLVAALRQVYSQLYALDQELATLKEAEELLEALEETARERYTAGLTSQESLVKVSLQQARLRERQTFVQQQRAETLAVLNKLLNRPLGSSLGAVGTLPAPPAPPSRWQELVLEKAPQLLLARARVTLAAREVEVSEKELKPNLFASFGLAEQRNMGTMAHLGAGMEWPLWKASKQKLQLAAARLRLEASRAGEAATMAELRQAVEQAQAAWQAAQEQTARYQQELLPLAEAAFNAARSAFSVGQADFSTVIEDFQLWLDTRVGLARSEADVFSAWAEIQALVGDFGGEG